jgi:hypothetical protein
MKYFDGRDVLLGDQVDLGGEMTGVVVACIEDEKFEPDFTKEQWGYLINGILVDSEQAGIVYYNEPCIDLTLLKRKGWN